MAHWLQVSFSSRTYVSGSQFLELQLRGADASNLRHRHSRVHTHHRNEIKVLNEECQTREATLVPDHQDQSLSHSLLFRYFSVESLLSARPRFLSVGIRLLCHTCEYVQRQAEGCIGSLTSVVGTGNQTWVLGHNSKRSLPRSHLSSP